MTPAHYGKDAVIGYIYTLMNAVDAVKDMAKVQPNAPRRVRLETVRLKNSVELYFDDNGIGFRDPKDYDRYGKEEFSTKGTNGTSAVETAYILSDMDASLRAQKSPIDGYATRIAMRFPLEPGDKR